MKLLHKSQNISVLMKIQFYTLGKENYLSSCHSLQSSVVYKQTNGTKVLQKVALEFILPPPLYFYKFCVTAFLWCSVALCR